MTYCVGLTGTIASGKSTVADLFNKLSVDVIDADKISKDLTAKNHLAYNKIVAHFGPSVLLETNELNRRALREIICSKVEEKRWLEDLLHPLIRELIEQKIERCVYPYCIIEIPLLIDKAMYPYLNKVLLIRSTNSLQIARIMERDHCSKEQALAMLQVQPETSLREKLADDIIDNNLDLKNLENKVDILHQKYLKEAQTQI